VTEQIAGLKKKDDPGEPEPEPEAESEPEPEPHAETQRGETHAALSTPNCYNCRHVSPESVCLGKTVDLSAAQQQLVHQARLISSPRLVCSITHVLI
jgi:hypothetical protein